MERRHQHRSGFRDSQPGQPTAGQTCPRKVPAVTTSALPHNAKRFKVPAQNNPVKIWKFRKADWKRFCLLTGESVERLPSPDTSNIERHKRIFARAYYPQPNKISHVAAGRTICHAGTKSARPSIAPSSEPQSELTVMAPPHHY